MADEPLQYADKTTCGANIFRDRGYGHAQGPLRANADQALRDRALVEREAQNAAMANAWQLAGEVASRKCPASCKRKSSASDPHEPAPTIRGASIYWSGQSIEVVKDDEVNGTHVLVKAYRHVAYASADWEVRFTCD